MSKAKHKAKAKRRAAASLNRRAFANSVKPPLSQSWSWCARRENRDASKSAVGRRSARARAERWPTKSFRIDRRRARRMAANDDLGGRAPAPTKKREGAFDALRAHPLYRAPRHGAHRP